MRKLTKTEIKLAALATSLSLAMVGASYKEIELMVAMLSVTAALAFSMFFEAVKNASKGA